MTLNNIFIPCMLTSMTTMVGFFSMLINKMIPLQEFGVYTGIGIGFAFVLSITLIPILFSYTNIKDGYSKKERKLFTFRKIVKMIGERNIKHKNKILVLSLLIIIISIYGTSFLEIDTRPYNYFGKNNEIYVSEKLIREKLSGTASLYILISGNENNLILNYEVIKEIEDLVTFLQRQREVGKVISITDLIKYINYKINEDKDEYYKIPDNTKKIKELLFIAEISDESNIINELISWKNEKTYLIIRSGKECNDTNEISILTKKIRKYLKKIELKNYKFDLVGTSILIIKGVDLLINGLQKSLIIASVAIFIIMILLFRSFKIGIISMIPNMLPILITLGLMGLLGIELNFITSAFACVSLGLAVDDTIHFLARFKKEIKKDGDTVAAMFRTLEVTGKAIIFTSIVFAA